MSRITRVAATLIATSAIAITATPAIATASTARERTLTTQLAKARRAIADRNVVITAQQLEIRRLNAENVTLMTATLSRALMALTPAEIFANVLPMIYSVLPNSPDSGYTTSASTGTYTTFTTQDYSFHQFLDVP